MNDAALRKWAERYPYTDVSAAILRVLDESAAKDKLIAGQAERIAAQSDALSRVAERGVRRDPVNPLASVPVTYGDPVSDYSRPPSLTPPAVVQMPGPLGAPDGLPMGDPAPESLATDDVNLRNLEQSELAPK